MLQNYTANCSMHRMVISWYCDKGLFMLDIIMEIAFRRIQRSSNRERRKGTFLTGIHMIKRQKTSLVFVL